MKRSIPLSEGFEICFCLRVSEREKRREGEEKAQTETQRPTEDQSSQSAMTY